MASLPANASREEIEDEIMYQETMLGSLEDYGDDSRRSEIEAILRHLEERLASHHSGDSADAGEPSGDSTRRSSTASTVDSQMPEGMPPIPGSFPHARPERPLHANGAISSPNSAASSATSFNPSSTSASKRPYHMAEPDDAEAMRNKRRTHSEFGRPSLMGSQSNEQRRSAWIEKQRELEAAAEARRQSNMADAAVAWNLSQQSPSASTSGPSRSTPAQASSKVETDPSQWHKVFRPPGYRKPKPEPSPSPSSSMLPPIKSEQSSASKSWPWATAPSYDLTAKSFPSSSRVKAESSSYSSVNGSPYQPNVKTESSMRSNLPTPRVSSSSSSGVIDLTGSDNEAEVVDLTDSNASTNINEIFRRANDRANEHRQRWEQHNNNLARQRELLRRRDSLAQQAVQYQAQQPYRYGAIAESVYDGLPKHPAYTSMGQAARNYLDTSVGNLKALTDMAQARAQAAQASDLITGRSAYNDPYAALRRAGLPGMGFPGTDYSRELDHADPEEVREELLKLVDNIAPDEDASNVVDEDIEIEGLTIKLKPYQNTGLKWLQKMEEGSNKGGILADDMGLGKTVQAIALMVTRPSEDLACKTTLILAPVALLRQWEQEIASKIRRGRHSLSTFIHHSGHKAKSFAQLSEYDVVLTTYGTIAAEHKKMERFQARKRIDSEAHPRPDERCMFIGSDSRWYRIIIDEAQCIKNRSTRTAKASYEIRAKSRFCMTGTPMMNSVEELFSLIHFLRIRPYNNWNKFRADFVTGMKGREEFRNEAMTKLQALLKAILLRRNKKTEINGKPILTLPERSVEAVNPEFSEDEQSYYTALESQSALTVNKYLQAGTIGNQYAHVLLLLLRLRQACCHPHLIKEHGVVGAAADISAETMDDLCRSLDERVIVRVKEANGVFECPICYDGVENPALFVPCGHNACGECFTRMTDPSQAVQHGDVDGQSARCPVCRGPINTKKVVDYECFKKIHMSVDEQIQTLISDEVETESEESDSDDEDDSDDDGDDGTLNGFIVRDDVTTESEGQNTEEEDNEEGAATSAQTAKAKQVALRKKIRKSRKAKGKQKASGKRKFSKADLNQMSNPELKKYGAKSAKNKKEYFSIIEKRFIPSAKTEKTIEILRPIMEADDGEKIIVFSQWTSLLDLVEIPIHKEGWNFCRYDGSMNAKARADAVDEFKSKPSLRIMLVSLKAGNAGLNLNVASQVILLDPFWNPYIEEQAIDRAHRLGQTRPVKVHRVLVENTVEDRIIALQEKKRSLISQALDEKAGQSVSRLSARDLAYLFGINRNINDAVPPQGRR